VELFLHATYTVWCIELSGTSQLKPEFYAVLDMDEVALGRQDFSEWRSSTNAARPSSSELLYGCHQNNERARSGGLQTKQRSFAYRRHIGQAGLSLYLSLLEI
jgi:hypothetical protein